MNASTASGAAERFIGRRVRRKEDARLLVGRGTFTDDVILPGMLHCAFVRSPIARGIIKSIDTAVAREQPGVVSVFTAEELATIPAYVALSYFMTPPPFTQVHPLASGRAAYVGDPVAIVIAQDRYLAEDAASLVEVEYEEQQPIVTIGDARMGEAIHPELPDNVAATTGESELDAELRSIFANAHKVVSRTVTHHRTTHSPIETRAIIASPNGEHDLTVYVGCQSPQTAARQISAALNMPDKNIRVISRDVGGSFGLKGSIWREEYAVIVAALLLRRPVKWIEDRLENLTAANQTREQECTLTVAFDENARLLGSHMLFEQNDGAFPTTLDNNMAIPMFMWGAYKMPKYGFKTTGYHSNTVGIAPYRGPWAMESLARETLLDIAAREFGISPVEIRQRNLVKASDQPTTSVMGFPIEDIRPYECLELLLQNIDVAAFRREQAAARKDGRLLGLGIATYIEPTVVAMPSTKSDIAQIRIEPSGAVSAVLSTHSQGHGTETTMTQVIADTLGIPMETITVHESDSAQGGYGIGAGGSRQAITGGGASIRASRMLVDKIKAIAAHLSNSSIEQVSIVSGRVQIEGVPEMDRS
ncbi:MAG: xanthine dehydrogenase family protein molybdopterin-binding subunit, partial [Novosphingobium sp.]|nr:xanthine dehydrogenase family protein molybdopterin-binding subunit [Novosphingobium sp.]